LHREGPRSSRQIGTGPRQGAFLSYDSGLKTRPSELFQGNCWISFEPVEGSLAVLADYIGPHKIMWATDYGHSDSFFPGAPQMMRDRLQPLSPEARHQAMTGGLWGSTV
jgi:uncharacterized protein